VYDSSYDLDYIFDDIEEGRDEEWWEDAVNNNPMPIGQA